MDRPDETESADGRRGPSFGWRDPLFWLVVGPPVAAVIGGLVTVWIAFSHRDPLVTETVRKVGVTWQDPAAGAAVPASAPAASATDATPPPVDDAGDDSGDDDGG